MKRYSSRQITRTLKKYDITEVEVVLDEGLRLSMVETADAFFSIDFR